jgi:hypothetical protein
MWFLSWRKWLKGSALDEAVQAGPHGSAFVSVQSAPSTAPSTTTTPG